MKKMEDRIQALEKLIDPQPQIGSKQDYTLHKFLATLTRDEKQKISSCLSQKDWKDKQKVLLIMKELVNKYGKSIYETELDNFWLYKAREFRRRKFTYFNKTISKMIRETEKNRAGKLKQWDS